MSARARTPGGAGGRGDLVHTGPTGTNVGDLVIGLKLPLADAAELVQRSAAVAQHPGAGTRVL